MARLSLARWTVLVLLLGLSVLSSAVYAHFQWDRLFPVEGWFFGGFADFKSFWLAGRLMGEDRLAVLFDQVAFNFERQAFFPFDGGHVWSYPLHVLLFARPLSLLPYPVAASLWMALGAACLLWMASRAGRSWPAALVVIACAGTTFFWFWLGQLSPITGLLLFCATVLAPTRPLLAGLCLGILSVKPQLALLAGLLLLVTSQWRPILVGVATCLAMVLATTAMIGVEPWIGLMRDAAPTQRDVMFNWRPVQPLISTVYAELIFLWVPKGAAWAAQLVVSAAVFGCALWAAASRLPWREKAAMAVCATVAGLPYILVYDHVLLFPLLLPDLLDPRTSFPRFLILAVVLTLASFGVMLFLVTGIPLLPAAMLLMMASQVAKARRILREQATGAPRPALGLRRGDAAQAAA
ncbi:MAG: glycosyltransferase family 87 protein [Alsobacter sp.]